MTTTAHGAEAEAIATEAIVATDWQALAKSAIEAWERCKTVRAGAETAQETAVETTATEVKVATHRQALADDETKEGRTDTKLTKENATKPQQEQSGKDKERAFRIRLEEIDLERDSKDLQTITTLLQGMAQSRLGTKGCEDTRRENRD